MDQVNAGNGIDTRVDALRDPEILGLVGEKISTLRKRLLDFSRRNPLVHLAYRANSTSTLWAVDELPDILRHRITHGSMRLTALPPLHEDPRDEQDETFQAELGVWRHTDETYLKALEKLDRSARTAAEAERKIEREQKDRLRAHLGMPPRQTKADTSLAQHARLHGVEPSLALPNPDDLHEDGRHEDDDIQTLLLPEKLIRVAKGIAEKARGFERETGVNVLHTIFGILQWQAPGSSDLNSSPLVLLECRVERRQSARGVEFHVAGTDLPSLNTTVAEKLAAEHGPALPAYDGHSVEGYFAAVGRMAPKGWSWEVRHEVVVGIFPSSRIAMYHDLDPARRSLAENPIVGRLLATAGADAGGYAPDYETDDKAAAAKVPHLVLDADASQYSALVDVADGKDLAMPRRRSVIFRAECVPWQAAAANPASRRLPPQGPRTRRSDPAPYRRQGLRRPQTRSARRLLAGCHPPGVVECWIARLTTAPGGRLGRSRFHPPRAWRSPLFLEAASRNDCSTRLKAKHDAVPARGAGPG